MSLDCEQKFIPMVKRIGILVLILLAFGANAHAQSDNKTEWYRFWVGSWDLTWQDTNGQEGKGTNVVREVLDGTVIEENFEAIAGSQTGYKGKSLSILSQPNGVWRQVWVDNQGGYIEFTGRKDGDRYYFETEVTTTPAGAQVQSRMVFYDITENSLTWDWERTQDGGDTWILNWRIHYTKQQ